MKFISSVVACVCVCVCSLFMYCTDPPESIAPDENVTRSALLSESFVFDCTPSAANPPASNYTFKRNGSIITEGVSGSVLTINPVVRSSRGVYTCTANNTAGTEVVTRNLFVVGELCVQ